MDQDLVVQPLVCCLGFPVGGNPTQFVLSRVAKELGCDWRFFTSQVKPTDLTTAFRGIQALGMQGAAILDPFQADVLPLLDSVTASAMVMNRVNVVRCDGSSWLGDHTLGTAISDCIVNELTRQEATGPQRIVVVGSESLMRTIQLTEAAWLNEHRLEWYPTSDNLPSTVVIDDATEEKLDASTSVGGARPVPLSWDDVVQGAPIAVTILDSESTPLSLHQLLAMPWTTLPAVAIIGDAKPEWKTVVQSLARERDIRRIESIDVLTHELAAAFFFWTQLQPNRNTIREALEEYLQW